MASQTPGVDALFCTDDEWTNLILQEHRWPGYDPDRDAAATFSAGEPSIGLTLGDAASPITFVGFKLDPISGAVAMSVSLPSQWVEVVRVLHARFERAHRARNPGKETLLRYPSPMVDEAALDLLLDTRQTTLRGGGGEEAWSSLKPGAKICATVHFGGYVSNWAQTHMHLTCSAVLSGVLSEALSAAAGAPQSGRGKDPHPPETASPRAQIPI